MKIFFDCRYIRVDHHDGISRFSSELFSAFSDISPVTALISDKAQLKWLPEGTEFVIGGNPTDGFAEIFTALRLNKAGATHVFSPMQTMGSFGRKFKLVLTLHDLIYYSHPTPPPALPLTVRFAWRIYHLSFWPARVLLNRADAVATVSETSKELIEKNRLTRKPVHVVYNAVSKAREISTYSNWETASSHKQLIYMGSFMEYKNVEALVLGMRELPEFELVLLSKISQARKLELLRIAGEAGSRIVFRDGVSEETYATYLSQAFALVSASRDEGFGIPLVEAMGYGLPVVVSDIPIFREVAGAAGVYFDPSEPVDFVDAIRKLDSRDTWNSFSQQGISRSKFFDWDESARKLLQVLTEL